MLSSPANAVLAIGLMHVIAMMIAPSAIPMPPRSAARQLSGASTVPSSEVDVAPGAGAIRRPARVPSSAA
ncbi:Uncharacterised protein [Mycobacteroides abscessus subsp. abscessus]|nr:Uncharacterised protein [Mycobacteroides abscessus subsp. abscessus]